jgi:hypothetical protein
MFRGIVARAIKTYIKNLVKTGKLLRGTNKRLGSSNGKGATTVQRDRNIQVLVTGLCAAHERMFSDKGLQRPEYPRNLPKLYAGMEDELYALFNAIQDKKYTLVRENAADIIVAAAKIIEYAELLARVANKPWDTKDDR